MDRIIQERPSRRPAAINDAARHELDRDLFAAVEASNVVTYERRRSSWIDFTSGMAECGYEPTNDPLIVPHGALRWIRRGDDDGGTAA